MKLGRFLGLLGGFTLLFAVGLVSFNFLVMPRLIHHNPVVAVPDLRGKTVELARGEAGRAGLQLIEDRTAAHPSVAAGRVVEQTPAPGSSIRRGRRVTVVVSGGPAQGTVPDLAGLTRRQAGMLLARESFREGRVLRYRTDLVTAPTVTFQKPPAGTRHLKAQPIDLVVAEPDQAPAYRLPDLRGEPLYLARLAIEEAGCVVAAVTHRREPGVAPGTVLAQAPSPGSRVLKGATIELVASAR